MRTYAWLCCLGSVCLLVASCVGAGAGSGPPQNAATATAAVPGRKAVTKIESISFASRTYQISQDGQGKAVRHHQWSAFVTYYADRRIEGSHLSGEPPFVHQDNATLTGEAFGALWKAAERICSLELPADPQVDPLWTSYEELPISGLNESTGAQESVHIVWQVKPDKKEPPPEVKALLEEMLKYRTGGW